MRKLFLLILFAWVGLHCTSAYRKIIPPDLIEVDRQQDLHWLYFRLEDRVAVLPRDAVGRSKKGDLVQVLPVTRQFRPTTREQQEYAIIKVVGMTAQDISDFTSSWEDTVSTAQGDSTFSLSYRRWETDVDFLSIIKGLDTSRVNFSSIKTCITRKTSATLLGYERKCAVERYVNVPIRRSVNRILPKKAFATEQIKTCNKTGEDYNTIVLWEDAEDGAMTTGNPDVLECYDDDGILKNSTRVDINGWTNNDATTQIIVRTASGEQHTGTDSTGFQRENTGSSINSFLIREEFTIIQGLEINQNGVTNRGVYLLNADNITLRDCLLFGGGSGFPMVSLESGDGVLIFNNCIYENAQTGLIYSTGNLASIINNTFYNNASRGLRINASSPDSVLVINNASFDSGTSDDIAGGTLARTGSTNNMTEDLTGDDGNLANGTTGLTATDQFTSPAAPTNDFSVLDTGANIYNGGDDQSGTVDVDIIGTARPQASTYDVGAFEFVVAAGADPATPKKGRPFIFGKNYIESNDSLYVNLDKLKLR